MENFKLLEMSYVKETKLYYIQIEKWMSKILNEEIKINNG